MIATSAARTSTRASSTARRKDLVFLDATTRQLARRKSSDLPKDQVRAAFEHFGYPRAGTTDPHKNDVPSGSTATRP
ncbi:hypothetical protein OU415_20805 [Saccharopolyspora sp. WRP15-2]|uniref:YqeB PH domain-containing protein n=1 Tax=Saccharopolyspora oryzae TaxID=2997343 RepID=A0ABT4V393_9PSEU|nr:hypothetical protein [Saccharopolyspora oryzae]MDA3627886.1 hypothetical protein [Saccharopolyspora oryzae]